MLVIIIRSTHEAFLNEKWVLFYIFPRQVPGTAKNERLPRHCGVQAWRWDLLTSYQAKKANSREKKTSNFQILECLRYLTNTELKFQPWSMVMAEKQALLWNIKKLFLGRFFLSMQKIEMIDQAAPGGRTPTMQSNRAILSLLSSVSSRYQNWPPW